MLSIEEFMAPVTKEQWEAELDRGWGGPNGSSMSTDHMMGVQIGISHPSYAFANYPANLHDYRYRLGRRFKLSRQYRRQADIEYRDGCIGFLEERLQGRTAITIGAMRAWGRFYILRLFGWIAWKA